MSILQALEKNKENLFELVCSSYSYKQVAKGVGYSEHGRNTQVVRKYLSDNGFDTSHFVAGNSPSIFFDKVCPVCRNTFKVNSGNKREVGKTTCSYSCANTYFRSGEKAGNYIHGNSSYVRIITEFHQKHNLTLDCVVCHTLDILDIHHADEDRDNNEVLNLVPLCPNHHAKWHRYKDSEVFDAIVNYQDCIEKLL